MSNLLGGEFGFNAGDPGALESDSAQNGGDLGFNAGHPDALESDSAQNDNETESELDRILADLNCADPDTDPEPDPERDLEDVSEYARIPEYAYTTMPVPEYAQNFCSGPKINTLDGVPFELLIKITRRLQRQDINVLEQVNSYLRVQADRLRSDHKLHALYVVDVPRVGPAINTLTGLPFDLLCQITRKMKLEDLYALFSSSHYFDPLSSLSSDILDDWIRHVHKVVPEYGVVYTNKKSGFARNIDETQS